MAPITTGIVPLLALLLGATNAFVIPVGRGASWTLQHQPRTTSNTPTLARNAAPRAVRSRAAIRMSSETVEDKVARLRETAAEFRAQAAILEDQREEERRAGAHRSFNTFDSNKDGAVDVAELQAGLAGPLRNSFTKQLTARMGRKPSREEVDARIAELPGGSLFPEDLARKLIAVYDSNDDGVLQVSEFAPTEELRARLENMFRQQREEEREARVAERERANAEKMAAAGAGGAVVSTDGSNDGPATVADKALSALPYVLPLVDGLSYAGHLFTAYPEQMAWAQPLAVLLLAFRSVPFAPLVTFFGLQVLGSNPKINKLVRFNMRQAVNLDIALILPGILGALTNASLGQDASKLAPLTEAGSDVVFVSLLLAVAYSVGSSAVGSFPNKLPLLGRLNSENPEQENE